MPCSASTRRMARKAAPRSGAPAAAASPGGATPAPGTATSSPGAAAPSPRGPAAPVRVVDVVPADPDDPRGAALAGRAGAALGALLMILVGNPLSGVSSAPELLPAPAGTIGQLLPPGAGWHPAARHRLLRRRRGHRTPGRAGRLGLALTWVAALRRPGRARWGAREGDPVAVA
jgi:hypothetical protein